MRSCFGCELMCASPLVIPGWSEGPDPELRDTPRCGIWHPGSRASHRPGMTKLRLTSQHDHHPHHRRRQSQDRLDQAGAVAVRGLPDRADRAAAVVAGGLQRHRQGQSPDAAEFRHAVHRSGFSRSAADHRDHRHHLGHDLLPGRRADGMAGVAHRHAGAAVHPRAGHGLVRDAAVSRRGRLGIAGRAQQRTAQPAVSLT